MSNIFGSWWQTGCTFWIICWCHLLIVSGVAAQLPKLRYAEDSLLRAQCKVRCLKKFVHDVIDKAAANDSAWKKYEQTLRSRPDLVLPMCRRSSVFNCNQCLDKGCEARDINDCRSLCKGNSYCQFGCDSLVRLVHKKSGRCPTMSIRTSSCYNQCQTDADCGFALAKCCNDGCGRKCVSPIPATKTIPKVRRTQIFEKERKRKLEMKWKYLNSSDYREPVLFVVQVSIYSGRVFEWQYASKWEQLYITTGTHSELEDLRIGVWYRFRIAAVSASGTRGFADNITPVQLSEKPQPPTPPRNVTDGTWRIHASGSINVEITWSPPARIDLPLSRYTIQWVKDLGYVQSDGQSLEGFTKFKKSVPPDKNKYTIENLESDASYKVQVVAYANWGSETMNSQPNTLFITAPTLRTSPDNEDNDALTEAALLGNGCRCGKDKPRSSSDNPELLHIYKPEFENSSLNLRILLMTNQRDDIPYAVEWKPEVCIAAAAKPERTHSPTRGTMKGQLFRIKGLTFNCRYSLKLTPLDSASPNLGVIKSCFCTPSCRDVKLANPAVRPVCYADDSLPLPSKPEDIDSHVLNPKALHYLLKWKAPKKSNPFNKYRVMWGPREEEPVNKDVYGDKYGDLRPKLDFQYTEIKVMPKNVTSIILKNLKRATLYIAKVQTLSYNNGKESESMEAVHYFTTEGFTNPVAIYEPHVVSKYIRPHGRAASSFNIIPLLTIVCSSLTYLHIRFVFGT